MAIIRYKESDTICLIHAYASYLSVSCDSSQSGGHHYLSNNLDDSQNNGAIKTINKIIGNVMGSEAKGEIGSTYINAQDALPLQTCLIETGHPQPPTKIQIDNSAA